MNKLKEAIWNHDIVERDIKEDSILTKAVKMAAKAQERAKEAMASINNQICQLNANCLSEEAKQPWNKIALNKSITVCGETWGV